MSSLDILIDDFYNLLITGFISLIVIITYGKMQENENKSNLIDILQTEIARNRNCTLDHEHNKDLNKFEDNISADIYNGLLHSGNIKYFKKDTQSQLHRLYNQFLIYNDNISDNNSKIDLIFNDKILTNVNEKLEYMKLYTKYWHFAKISVWFKKRKNNYHKI